MARKWINIHTGMLRQERPCIRVKGEDGRKTVHASVKVLGPSWFEKDGGTVWLVTDAELEVAHGAEQLGS